jgi:Tfp pilus assembly protein PilX
MRSHRRYGSTLVAALLVSVVLLIAGLGFLGQRAAQNRAVNASILKLRSRALAEAGLQDALQKLSKDGQFPPLYANQQSEFTYLETVAGVGNYTVTVDITHRQPPYSVIRLTSTGRVGTPDTPQSDTQLSGELDVAPLTRGTSNPNPNFFRLLYVRTSRPF